MLICDDCGAEFGIDGPSGWEGSDEYPDCGGRLCEED